MVEGKNVVVTGKIAGHDRQSAQEALRQLGANVQSSVGPTTDLLVMGAAVGKTKMNAAEKHGAVCVSWDDAVSGRESAENGASEVEAASSPSVVAAQPERAQSRTVIPMLALKTERDVMPEGGDWTYEVKWDGWRFIATVQDGKVAVQSRSAKGDLNGRYPHIEAELAKLPDCILDGEVAVLDANGNSAFEQLHTGEAKFIVYDILEWEGVCQKDHPLSLRREHIVAALDGRGLRHILQSPVFTDGDNLYAWAEAQGIEGIMAKRASGRYVEGQRRDWLKIKIRQVDEFAVIGWKPGVGNRAGTIGGVVVAQAMHDETHGDTTWVYAGTVGTGATYDEWEAIKNAQTTLDGRPDRILTGAEPAWKLRDIQWVEPTMVVQVEYQRWTDGAIGDRRLWHPALLGVREDKTPAECTIDNDLQVAA